MSYKQTQIVFEAFNSADVTNATGDGTQVTVVFGSTNINQSSAYNASTGIFTAPKAGNYLFLATVTAGAVTSTAWNVGKLVLVTTARNYTGQLLNPGTVFTGNNTVGLIFHHIVPMAAGDTAMIQINVSGSTKTISIRGDTGDSLTYFSGCYLSG